MKIQSHQDGDIIDITGHVYLRKEETLNEWTEDQTIVSKLYCSFSGENWEWATVTVEFPVNEESQEIEFSGYDIVEESDSDWDDNPETEWILQKIKKLL